MMVIRLSSWRCIREALYGHASTSSMKRQPEPGHEHSGQRRCGPEQGGAAVVLMVVTFFVDRVNS
jgi:hypothetical protein